MKYIHERMKEIEDSEKQRLEKLKQYSFDDDEDVKRVKEKVANKGEEAAAAKNPQPTEEELKKMKEEESAEIDRLTKEVLDLMTPEQRAKVLCFLIGRLCISLSLSLACIYTQVETFVQLLLLFTVHIFSLSLLFACYLFYFTFLSSLESLY